MKKLIILLFLVGCQTFAIGQNDQLYKEIVENYYARSKSEFKFKLIKSEITNIKESFMYIKDSLSLKSIEKLLRKAHSQSYNTNLSNEQRQILKDITMETLTIYFTSNELYQKRDKSKIYLISGNILYGIEENLNKKNLYENFIIALDSKKEFLLCYVIED